MSLFELRRKRLALLAGAFFMCAIPAAAVNLLSSTVSTPTVNTGTAGQLVTTGTPGVLFAAAVTDYRLNRAYAISNDPNTLMQGTSDWAVDFTLSGNGLSPGTHVPLIIQYAYDASVITSAANGNAAFSFRIGPNAQGQNVDIFRARSNTFGSGFFDQCETRFPQGGDHAAGACAGAFSGSGFVADPVSVIGQNNLEVLLVANTEAGTADAYSTGRILGISVPVGITWAYGQGVTGNPLNFHTVQIPRATLRDTNGGIRLSTYASAALSNAGGSFASDPSAAEDLNGNVIAAARDSSNAVWTNIYNVTTATWLGWQPGGGSIQGVPAIAATPDGTAWIAARDSTTAYWLLSYTTGGGYGSWIPLHGSFTTDPVIAACSDGSIYVVGKDSSNALWSGRYIPGTGFQNFVPLGGAVTGKPSVSCGGDNAIYIVGRDSSNSNWMARVLGNTWTGWFNGGAGTSIDPRIVPVGGGPAVVILDGGGSVWRNTFTEGTGNGWQTWTNVGGGFSDISPAGVDGELFFIAKALNNDLWWWRQTGNLFTGIGNNGVAVGALSTAPR